MRAARSSCTSSTTTACRSPATSAPFAACSRRTARRTRGRRLRLARQRDGPPPLAGGGGCRIGLGLVPRDASAGTYYPTATSVPRGLVAPFSGVRRGGRRPGRRRGLAPGGLLGPPLLALLRRVCAGRGRRDVASRRAVVEPRLVRGRARESLSRAVEPAVLVRKGEDGGPQPVLHPRAALRRRRMARPRAVLAGRRLRLRVGPRLSRRPQAAGRASRRTRRASRRERSRAGPTLPVTRSPSP